MDKYTYENWVRVKTTFEESGNTDNLFYQRACAIVSGGPDPLDKMLGKPTQNDTQDDGTET
jgi:hypothetical protein